MLTASQRSRAVISPCTGAWGSNTETANGDAPVADIVVSRTSGPREGLRVRCSIEARKGETGAARAAGATFVRDVSPKRATGAPPPL